MFADVMGREGRRVKSWTLPFLASAMWAPYRQPASRKAGHTVVGVDLNEGKVELINAGKSPVIERGVDRMIAQAVAEGRLRATTDPSAAIRDSELALVCVGTPSRGNGDLDLSHVRRVCEDIAEALRDEGRIRRNRHPQHRPAGHAPQYGHPDAGRRIRKEGRARFRCGLLPGVSKGKHRSRRLLPSAKNRDRSQR